MFHVGSCTFCRILCLRLKIEDELGTTEDRVAYLQELQEFISGTPPLLEELNAVEQNDDSQCEKTKVDYESLQQQFKEMQELYKQQMKEALAKLEAMKLSAPPAPISKPSESAVQMVDLKTALRWDFKIQGTIGSDSQKDRLSFVSLVRQVDAGLEKGYQERKIVDSVIRAINPSLKLRSYLETMKDLTLPKLRQMLRSHYKQKSGTELYQQLTTICQAPKEASQDFLIRELDLQQQVIFTSQAADDPVRYEPSLVHSLFLHAVETGLQDEAVRTKLRPILQKKGVTDEELMEHINIAESEETERKNKFGATSQRSAPKVNQVEAENVRESASPFRKPVAKRNRNTTNYKPATGFH